MDSHRRIWTVSGLWSEMIDWVCIGTPDHAHMTNNLNKTIQNKRRLEEMSNKFDAKNSQKNTVTVSVGERIRIYSIFATDPRFGFKPLPEFTAAKDVDQLLAIMSKHGSFKVDIPTDVLRRDAESFLRCLYAMKIFTATTKKVPKEPLDVLEHLMRNCEHATDFELERVEEEEEPEVIHVDSLEDLIMNIEKIRREHPDAKIGVIMKKEE